MIERFRVKNYKSLADVDIPLTPIHVIVGQNDSGKTSLLEAIYAFCRSTSTVSINQAFLGKWEYRELAYHGAKSPEVELGASILRVGPGHRLAIEYGFHITFATRPNPNPHPRVHSEYYSVGEKRVSLSTNNSNATAIGWRHNFPLPDVETLDTIAESIEPCFYYRFDPKIMSIPASLDSGRRFRMDPDGFGLPTLLDDINGHDAARFLELSGRFCEYFPEFRRIRLETEPAVTSGYNQQSGTHTMTHGMGKGIVFETHGAESIRAQQASDGAILFLGFLAQLYLPDPPRVLLIEEPEKGVYPKRIEQIVGLLRKLTELPGVETPPQIILTTHSPFLVSSFKPEEVTMMRRRGDRVIASPLRDAPDIRERLGEDEFYLGELWYNLDEEELFQDARS